MPLILGTNSIKDTGYDVANSVRMNDGSSDYFNRTQGTPTNADKFTLSVWVKRCGLTTSDYHYIASFDGGSNPREHIRFNDGTDQLTWYFRDGSGTASDLTTNRLFRDVSAWYHILCVYDSTQGTNSNRQKIYVNGVQETSFSSSGYVAQNTDSNLNTNSNNIKIGALGISSPNAGFFDGYMAEYVFIDGQALDPTSFGEFDEDSGIWKPIDVSGLTFGNNGFYLDFEDSSALGNDANGSNNFTVNNLTATDQSTDTCTNNFATWNPLNVPTSNAPVFSEGNCNLASAANAAEFTGTSTIGVTNGKWYAEFKNTAGSYCIVGITSNPGEDARNNVRPGTYTTSWGYNASGSGEVQNNNSGITYTCDSWTTNDIIGVYIDCDNSKLYFAKNGTVQNSGTGISLVSGDTYFFTQGDGDNSSSSTLAANFGGCPAFTISSGNADANGYGNFEYDPSSGTFDSASKDFLALCTKNLAEYG